MSDQKIATPAILGSAAQPALDALLQSRCCSSLSQLLATSPDILDRLRLRGDERDSFRRATQDFQTVVLNTSLIADTEAHLRCTLLALLHFMPARYLETGVHGTDPQFQGLVCDDKGRSMLWFLVLRLIRATRGAAGATEDSRLRFVSYPDSYNGDVQGLFQRIVESARQSSGGQYLRPGAS